MISVSIAMCTYNGGAFIHEQLASLTSQTLRPCEIVIVDDGSADQTLDIVEDFSRTSSVPIKIFKNVTRLGFRENFIQAALRCTGEYISFCDQDDVWKPQKLERAIGAINSSNALLCAHAYDVVDKNLEYLFSGGPKFNKIYEPGTLKPWDCFPGFTQVFARRLLESVDPSRRPNDNIVFDQQLAHDRWTYILGTSLGRTVTLAESLVSYRQHGNNVYGAEKSKSIFKGLSKRILVNSSKDYYIFHRDSAEIIYDLLSELSKRNDAFGTEAVNGALYWRKVTDYYSLRADIYDQMRIDRAFIRFLKAVVGGAYGTPPGGGGQGLIKDFLSGVVNARRTGGTKLPAI